MRWFGFFYPGQQSCQSRAVFWLALCVEASPRTVEGKVPPRVETSRALPRSRSAQSGSLPLSPTRPALPCLLRRNASVSHSSSRELPPNCTITTTETKSLSPHHTAIRTMYATASRVVMGRAALAGRSGFHSTPRRMADAPLVAKKPMGAFRGGFVFLVPLR